MKNTTFKTLAVATAMFIGAGFAPALADETAPAPTTPTVNTATAETETVEEGAEAGADTAVGQPDNAVDPAPGAEADPVPAPGAEATPEKDTTNDEGDANPEGTVNEDVTAPKADEVAPGNEAEPKNDEAEPKKDETEPKNDEAVTEKIKVTLPYFKLVYENGGVKSVLPTDDFRGENAEMLKAKSCELRHVARYKADDNIVMNVLCYEDPSLSEKLTYVGLGENVKLINEGGVEAVFIDVPNLNDFANGETVIEFSKNTNGVKVYTPAKNKTPKPPVTAPEKKGDKVEAPKANKDKANVEPNKTPAPKAMPEANTAKVNAPEKLANTGASLAIAGMAVASGVVGGIATAFSRRKK